MVRETSVWARAQPADKVTIVESLQRMGYPSAMTGDGVNDAPALKLSDIGTAMGVTGTAVAKGAADLVLMNDDFTTIVDAVEEGRRTYANVQGYVSFYLSMCLPEIVMYGACLVVGIPMPLTQLQILGMAGIAHVIPPLTYSCQPLTDEAMHVPPRRKDSKLVPRATVIWIVIPWLIFFLTAWFSLNIYGYHKHTGYVFLEDIVAHEGIRDVADDNPFISDEYPLKLPGEPVKVSRDEISAVQKGSRTARTMNFLMACIAELLLTLAVSTEKPFAIFVTPNKQLIYAVFGCLCLAFFAVYIGHFIPKIMELTQFVPLNFEDLGTVLAFALGVHVLFEFTKIGFRNDTRALIELRRYHALAT
jgi:magnesium-transporting ATPase (P-type)